MPPKRKAGKGQKGEPSLEKPIKEIVLRQEHSLGLVHTALAATVFEVIWARKVFPTSTKWVVRLYDPSNRETSYESFVSGAQEHSKGSGRNWHVPIRDQHQALDRLMDNFEHGIKDALEKGYLAKVVLRFHLPGPAPVGEHNCIESYELSVSYGDGTPNISTEIRQSESPQHTGMSLCEGKTRFQTMLNGISEHLQLREVLNSLKMRPISGNIRLAIQLHYTEQAPPQYEPRNFVRYREAVWEEPDETGTKEDAKYKFETGFHGLAFSYTLPGHPGNQASSPPTVDETKTEAPRTELRSKETPLPSLRQRRSPSQFSSSDGGRTQPRVMAELQGIGISRLDRFTSQDTQQYPRASVHPPRSQPFPRYTEEVRVYAESKVRDLVARGDDIPAAPRSGRINCECRASSNDGPLVKCLECDDFHHAECYGYLSDAPRAEFCFTCARDLFPAGIKNLEHLRFVCQMRRTVRLLQNRRGSMTLKQMATHLGMDTYNKRNKDTMTSILKDLTDDGYVVDRRVDKSQEMTEASTFILATGKDAMILRRLFNPRDGVELLFVDKDKTTPVEAASLSGSAHGLELFVRGSASGFPNRPGPSISKERLTIRGLQDSSRRDFSPDTDTTLSTYSPNHSLNRGSREDSVNSEFQSMKLGRIAEQKSANPLTSSSLALPELSSGIKRSAEPDQQEQPARMTRSSQRRKMN